MHRRELKYHLRKTSLLAFPVIMSQLGQMLVGVADSAMVGRLGPAPLGASSLGHGAFMLIFIMAMGVGMALTPLIAKAQTERNPELIGRILKNGGYALLGTGSILFLGVMLSTDVFYLLDQPTEVVELTIPYVRILGWSFIPAVLFLWLKQFTEGLSFTFQAMIISLAGNILNIVLNYILIYGKFGFEAYGLNGAGYATLISRIFMFLGFAAFVLWYKGFREYLRSLLDWGADWPLIQKIFAIGIPTGLQHLFEIGAFIFAVVMMGWIGTNAMAAHQIALSMAALTFMVASGIASATTIRVGNQLGLKNIRQLRNVVFTSLIMGIAIMFFFGLSFAVGGRFFAGLFIYHEEVIALAAKLLLVAALFQISDGIQVISLGSLRGLQDVKIPALYTFLAYWGIGIPVAYFFGISMNFGAIGIWSGLAAGLTASAILLTRRFNQKSRRLMGEISEGG